MEPWKIAYVKHYRLPDVLNDNEALYAAQRLKEYFFADFSANTFKAGYEAGKSDAATEEGYR